MITNLDWLEQSQRLRIAQMVRAGLESIVFRQDLYDTGGIVESDERFDNGRKLYWPWCWCREFIVEPMLSAGMHERVKLFLNFWMRSQRNDGSWLHCYDVRDGSEFAGLAETDNVGYMLAHIGCYIKSTGNTQWLSDNYNHVIKSCDYLDNIFCREHQLVWGQEEANVPGSDSQLVRYSLHINCVCAWGLQHAAHMADIMNDHHRHDRLLNISEQILDSIENTLWDENEKCFVFGLADNNRKVCQPVLWMTLMPHWLFPERFKDYVDHTLDFLKRRCFNKDPLISNTYWIYDLSPLLESDKPYVNKYSGQGPWIGGIPVLVWAMLQAGRIDEARQQMEILFRFTDTHSLLVPEHINTLHHGMLNNYGCYPDGEFMVDPGNLLHESFFLTFIKRLAPEMLCLSNHSMD